MLPKDLTCVFNYNRRRIHSVHIEQALAERERDRVQKDYPSVTYGLKTLDEVELYLWNYLTNLSD